MKLNKRALAVSTACLIIVGGGAYAYVTTTGTGSGSGSASAILTFNSADGGAFGGSVSGLAPNNTAVSVAGTFTNPNSFSVKVKKVVIAPDAATVTALAAGETILGGPTPPEGLTDLQGFHGCATSDFTFAQADPVSPSPLISFPAGSGTWGSGLGKNVTIANGTVTMTDSSTHNQTACQTWLAGGVGHSLPLTFTVS